MHWHDPSRIPERGVPVFCLSSLLGNVHHQGGQEQIRVEKGVGPKIIIAVIITDSSVPKKAKGSYSVFIYIYFFRSALGKDPGKVLAKISVAVLAQVCIEFPATAKCYVIIVSFVLATRNQNIQCVHPLDALYSLCILHLAASLMESDIAVRITLILFRSHACAKFVRSSGKPQCHQHRNQLRHLHSSCQGSHHHRPGYRGKSPTFVGCVPVMLSTDPLRKLHQQGLAWQCLSCHWSRRFLPMQRPRSFHQLKI